MFPLQLLPTIPDNLQNMKARDALLYQNAFMKNALIRALNIIYDVAPKISDRHPEFSSFMMYVETVCNLLALHLEGDDMFLEAIALHCTDSATVVTNKAPVKIRKDLESLLVLVGKWTKTPETYHHKDLQYSLKNMELNTANVLHSQISKFKGDALPKSIDDEILRALVRESMIWFGSRVEISILLPFCISHHDLQTSQHWPPVTPEAIQALPELAAVHPRLWKFAPFHPVTRLAATAVPF